jgi:valyl-tRNA synthetase
MIKPGYQQPIDADTLESAKNLFERILKIMHPFTPFITEEIWHWLRERKEGEDIIISSWPEPGNVDEALLKRFDVAFEAISNIRKIRKENNIAFKVPVDLFVKVNAESSPELDSVIQKMGNLSKLEYSDEKVANAFSFIVKNNEYYIPFGETVDVEEEKKKIKAELEYAEGSLNIVRKKLTNERFVNNAPEQVVASERRKEADALNKIQILTEKLADLSA